MRIFSYFRNCNSFKRGKILIISATQIHNDKIVMNIQIQKSKNSEIPCQFLEMMVAEIYFKKGIDIIPINDSNCYQISFNHLESLELFINQFISPCKFPEPEINIPFTIQFAFELIPKIFLDKDLFQSIRRKFKKLGIQIHLNLKTQIHEFIFPNEENYVLWLLEFIQRKSKIC